MSEDVRIEEQTSEQREARAAQDRAIEEAPTTGVPPHVKAIMAHMHRFGPNARLCIIAPNKSVLEAAMEQPGYGLLALHNSEFTGDYKHHKRLTHSLGGQAEAFTDKEDGRHGRGTQRMRGQQFSCVWVISTSDGGELAYLARKLNRIGSKEYYWTENPT